MACLRNENMIAVEPKTPQAPHCNLKFACVWHLAFHAVKAKVISQISWLIYNMLQTICSMNPRTHQTIYNVTREFFF